MNAKEQILFVFDKHEFYDTSLFIERIADEHTCTIALKLWSEVKNGEFDINSVDINSVDINGILCKIFADLLLFEKKYDIAHKYYCIFEDDDMFDNIKSFMHGEIGRFLEINNAVFHNIENENVVTPNMLYEEGCVYDDSNAYYYLSNYYRTKYDYEGMICMLEMSVTFDNCSTMNNLRDYYFQTEDIAKTVSYYLNEIVNRLNVGLYNCGNIYMSLKDYDKAYEYFKRGHNRGCRNCLHGLGNYYFVKGMFEDAFNCYKKYEEGETWPYEKYSLRNALKSMGDLFRFLYDNNGRFILIHPQFARHDQIQNSENKIFARVYYEHMLDCAKMIADHCKS